ncbi:MAG: rod shape-determining protein MreC [Oscillospiraceae bacterium]|nr:rod shape-determining protein MreC [Oscillospiraceae bacterium]
MKHWFSKKVRVVLVVALLLATGLAVVNSLTGLSLGEMTVQYVLTPMRTAASKLTDKAEQMYSYIFRYETLSAENESLKQQLAEMEDVARDADAMSRELKRLRELLQLKEQHSDYELIDGYIISRDSVDWNSNLTINRGSDHGLEVGMCAITSNGEVVGLISEVGKNYAVIKTIMDSSLQISGIIASSGYSGMVIGGYQTGLENMLRMEYLPSSAVLRNGDQVVTAGSTMYPRNLVLGKVVDASYTETGVAKYAILEPAADITGLEQVFVIVGFQVG